MNSLLRELLTDLKAAALIGHPDSLESALDGVRYLADDDLPPSALVLLGRALTPLPAKTLKPLFVDDDPAIRAVVSAAIGERYMQGKDVTAQDLDIPADDPNPEVRAVLARALSEFTPSRPDLLTPLVESWLQQTNQRSNKPHLFANPIHPALLLLPHLPNPSLSLLTELDSIEDHDFREALVTCLNTLAEKGHAVEVFDLLSEWASHTKPNIWVITRVLSASWAQAYRDKAIRILNDLAAQVGVIRPIVRALDRFG